MPARPIGCFQDQSDAKIRKTMNVRQGGIGDASEPADLGIGSTGPRDTVSAMGDRSGEHSNGPREGGAQESWLKRLCRVSGTVTREGICSGGFHATRCDGFGVLPNHWICADRRDLAIPNGSLAQIARGEWNRSDEPWCYAGRPQRESHSRASRTCRCVLSLSYGPRSEQSRTDGRGRSTRWPRKGGRSRWRIAGLRQSCTGGGVARDLRVSQSDGVRERLRRQWA